MKLETSSPLTRTEPDMHLRMLYSDFLAELPQSCERRELLRSLQRWLKSHLREWSAESRSAWRLEEFASMDLATFPIEESALSPTDEVRNLRLATPSSKDTFAMFLRDVIWEGITVAATTQCPNCESYAMKILHDKGTDELFLACDRCGWVETPNGVPSPRGRLLEPTTSARLQRYRDTGR